MTDILCSGFQAAGFHSGLKKNQHKDLGLIFSEVPATVAGVFTQNRVKAAPVLISRERVKNGLCRAVIVNSGNANCCTGNQGMQDAFDMAGCVGDALGVANEDVLVASTGVIGAPLPLEKIKSAAPELVQALNPNGFQDLAEAIMTTDTVPKLVHRQAEIEGQSFNIIGTAKGSGMIAPNMATMLCFVCTDAEVPGQTLAESLLNGVEKSLNRISIDGDTSTNDTTLILANGKSGVSIDNPGANEVFQRQLDQILTILARELVRDGEGVTKLVEIVIKGAASNENALTIAQTISTSALVKTALFGEDANWGRLAAAAGRSQVPFDPDSFDIYFDHVQMVKNGLGCGLRAEATATQVLKKPEFTITMDLKMGTASASMLTCDYSIDYVKINADYRS